MNHADISIIANGSRQFGRYGTNRARHGGLPGAWPNANGVLSLIGSWLARHRQRQALTQLDDRMLEDVGITRHQAEREVEKPFWRL